MLTIGIGNIRPHDTLMSAMHAGGFNKSQMAHAIGIHRTTMTRYCQGELEVPRAVALAALAVAMASGVTVSFESPFSELAVATKCR